MRLIPHSEEWYVWLSEKQPGYFYPGQRRIAPWHGEDTFREMIFAHLRPEMDVLEIACAQGDLSLAIAPRARSVLGYDATPRYIAMAQAAAAERGIGNARFVLYNGRGQFQGDGRARVPAEDQSVDLWVNSKGPFHPLEDARRVCRPGAVLLTLIAGGGAPSGSSPDPWAGLLPEPLRTLVRGDPDRHDPNWAYKSFTARFAQAGLRLHSWWDFDVPYLVPNPRELYTDLTWPFHEDDVPAFAEAAPALEQIFREFAGPGGLERRWRRSICKAVLAE